jgi:nicotinate-nucleotide adenylyltransferase
MRLALFGGTFDPIHNAHLAVAREACSACDLDAVWFVPNAVPPHKSRGPAATWKQRFDMVELACREEPRFQASRLEEENATSYTVNTLRKVRADRGEQDDLYFLIGADAFAEIGSWYRRDEVFSLVTFIVLSRPGHQFEHPTGAKLVNLETLSMDVSSSDIRTRIARGDLDIPVPRSVLDYIRMNQVYSQARTAGNG